MKFVKLTRMIESKSKDEEHGALVVIAFGARGEIWIQGDNIGSVSPFQATVEIAYNEYEERQVTEVRLIGTPEPLYVAESPEEILAALTDQAP